MNYRGTVIGGGWIIDLVYAFRLSHHSPCSTALSRFFSYVHSAIGFQDLSAELQKEVIDLQKRMAVELQPLVLESTLTMQKILECPDHSARLKLVRHFVQAETKRLSTKKAIQTMFGERSTPWLTKTEAKLFKTQKDPAPSSSSSSVPSEEPVSDAAGDSVRKSTDSTASESFFSEDDAFQ